MWMTGKSLIKQHNLKKKNFIAAKIWKILQMHITSMEKKFVTTLK